MTRRAARTGIILAVALGCACDSGSEVSTSAGSSGAAGAQVDCSAPDFRCFPGQYCDFPSCGRTIVSPISEWKCKDLPASCPPGGRAVCACDGQVYPNADCALIATKLEQCYAGRCAVAPTDSTTDCTAPSGSFQCRKVFCDSATEFCALSTCHFSWERGECLPFPSTCEAGLSCDCLLEATGFYQCVGNADEGFTVSKSTGPDSCN